MISREKWSPYRPLLCGRSTSFQIETGAAAEKRSLKRTTYFLLKSINTIRFEWLARAGRLVRWLARAGRLVRPGDRPVLRMVDNASTRKSVRQIEQRLQLAA